MLRLEARLVQRRGGECERRLEIESSSGAGIALPFGPCGRWGLRVCAGGDGRRMQCREEPGCGPSTLRESMEDSGREWPCSSNSTQGDSISGSSWKLSRATARLMWPSCGFCVVVVMSALLAAPAMAATYAPGTLPGTWPLSNDCCLIAHPHYLLVLNPLGVIGAWII